MDYVVWTSIYLVGLAINLKLLKVNNLEGRKNGGHLTQQVTKVFTMSQIILWPMITWVALDVTSSLTLLPDVFDSWICFAMKSAVHWFRLYLGFNSLVVAAMRYTFIVHDTKVAAFGKERARKIFLHASLIIPIAITILNEAVLGMAIEARPLLSKCLHNYGYFESNGTQHLGEGDADNGNHYLPIYMFFKNTFPRQLMTILHPFSTVLYLLVLSNIVEGCLYIKIFLHIKR